ncbi:hypothetical protein KA093_03880 [Candidatus Saccharibacteria bacterium]|nr:hypothetical protein [Candidatus Saccharibacteria bacterium]
MRGFSRRHSSSRQGKAEIAAQGISFRRSRTITGSTSSQVVAASETRGTLRSPRLHIHDLHVRRRWLTLVLVSVICAGGAVVWLLDQYIVSPQLSLLGSTNDVAASRYASQLEGYLSSHPFERFEFALSRTAMEASLQRAWPEILHATLSNESGLVAHRLTIELRKPVVTWKIGDTSYLVDSNGVMFENSTLPQPPVVVKDESGLPASTQQIASRTMMQFIGQTVGQISAQGVGTVQEVIIPPATLRRVDILLVDRAYRLRLSIDRDVTQQVSDIRNALTYIDDHELRPQYIDVRVEGRAYYLE